MCHILDRFIHYPNSDALERSNLESVSTLSFLASLDYNFKKYSSVLAISCLLTSFTVVALICYVLGSCVASEKRSRAVSVNFSLKGKI